MQKILLLLALFVYCSYPFFHNTPGLDLILSLLASCIVLCFSIFFDNKYIATALIFLYILLCIYHAPCLLFAPVICTEIYRLKLFPFICVILPLILYSFSTKKIAYLLLGLFLGLFLEYMNEKIIESKELLKRTRDDSVELNNILKAKNKLLLEKQDAETHTAMLTERNRIAREIHDNAGHILSRCILLTGAIKATNKDDSITDSLNLLSNELDNAMNNIRTSVHNLHDDSIDLKNEITKIVDAFKFCTVKLDYDMESNTPIKIKYAFLSITKEALTNVAKHSNATKVTIKTNEHPGMYQLIIFDNGTKSNTSSPGIGLINIRERIDALNGTLQINNDNGYKIFVSVPKNQNGG